MRTLYVACVMAAALACAATTSYSQEAKEPAWQVFAPPGGGFSVLVPSKPDERKIGPDEVRYDVSLEPRIADLKFGHFDLPADEVKGKTAEAILDRLMENINAGGEKAKVLSKKKLPAQAGLAGYEILVGKGKGNDEEFERFRFLSGGDQRIYLVAMMGPNRETLEGAIAERYFGSFKLLRASAPNPAPTPTPTPKVAPPTPTPTGGQVPATPPPGSDLEKYITQLRNPQAKTRSAAAQALGNLRSGAKAAVPALIEALRDSDPFVRNAAAFSLGSIHEEPEKAVPALVRLLEDSDPFVRSGAATGLMLFRRDAKPAFAALVKALDDEDSGVRSAALGCLGSIGPDAQQPIERFVKLLQDSDKYVRAAAALAFADLGDQGSSAVPALIKALGDEYAGVRSGAATALGQYPQAAVREALTKAENDADQTVRSAVAMSLRRMNDSPAPGPRSNPVVRPDPPVPPQTPTEVPGVVSRKYKTFQDPREGAFSVQTPAGWSVKGGTYRSANLRFTTFRMEAISPDRKMTIHLDVNEPGVIEPHPNLDQMNIRDGGMYPDGSGGFIPVRRYAPGGEYMIRYVMPGRGLAEAKVLTHRDRKDLVQAMVAIRGFDDVHAGEISYVFRKGDEEYRGAALAVTRIMQGQPGGLRNWHCGLAAFYEAPATHQSIAKEAMVRMLQTFRIEPRWAAGLDAAMKTTIGDISRASDDMASIISNAYWKRSRTYDGIFQADAVARRGIVELRDPRTGETYTMNNEPNANYFWIRPNGETRATADNDPPTQDAEPLMILEMREHR
ncbi:MAG: HEAT repeat domain-containing protein [Gemmataceae bacterium]